MSPKWVLVVVSGFDWSYRGFLRAAYGHRSLQRFPTGRPKRVRSDLAAGRLELFRAPVEQLPCESADFDAVLTVNTIYFWTAPERAMAELHRVLRVGGQLVVAFRSGSILEGYRYTRFGLSLYEPAVVEALLQRSGFRDTRLTGDHDDRLGYWCAIARR